MNIYRKVNGQAILIFSTPINKGCERKWELQGDDYITLKFSVSEPLVFKIGDYTDTTDDEGGEAGRWYITSAVRPTYNKANGAYVYEIKFEAEYKLWNNYIFKYISSTAEANWKLTATMDQHLEQILRNLEAFGLQTCWNGQNYNYYIDWEVYDSSSKVLYGVVSKEAKYVEYSSTKICDALDAIAEAWECEWWVQGSTIMFGYCEHENITHELRLGVNVESWDIEESSGTHANRVYVFGSTRNIPSNYRRSLILNPSRNKMDAGYWKLTDNNVKLSLKQIVPRTSEDKSVYMSLYSAGKIASITAEKGYDAGYTQSRIFHYTNTEVYDYVGMPHKLIFGKIVSGVPRPETNPIITLMINPKSLVDDKYVEDEQIRLDPDEVVFKVLVRLYMVNGSGTTKLFEFTNTYHKIVYIGNIFTNTITIKEIQSFNDGSEFGFDIECHVQNLYGSEVEITSIFTSDVIAQTLLAKPFNANLIGYADTIVKGDVIVFLGYQGLATPAEDASQNDKWAYAYDQQQKGIYYTFKNLGDNRILIPKASTQGDIPMSWYTDNFQSDSLYAIAERRLMLPTGTPYIQAEGLADNEIVEDVITMDDVYPRMKDMTIGALLWHEEDGVVTTYEDGTQSKERYKAYYFRDSIFTSTGEQSMKKAYVLAGQTARVRFGSGRLNGMEFDIELESGYTDEAGTTYSNWNKIIRNEDYGPKLPNSYLYPEEGDKIIYLGWDEAQMGNTGYVEAAEQELLVKGKEYLNKARINDRTYNITLMEYSRYGTSNLLDSDSKNLRESEGKQLQVISDNGQQIGFCKAHFIKGRVVKICDETATIYDKTQGKEVPYRMSRVIGFTHPLDIPYDHPTIKVGVSGIYSRLADIENKLRKSKNNG